MTKKETSETTDAESSSDEQQRQRQRQLQRRREAVAAELAAALEREDVAAVFGWNKETKDDDGNERANEYDDDDDEQQQRRRRRRTTNPLSGLLPGYTAPMRLDGGGGSSSLTVADARREDPADRRYLEASSSTTKTTTPKTTTKSRSRGAAAGNDGTAGPDWFHAASSPDPDGTLAADLRVLRNRNFLDPKRFYKATDRASDAGVVQRGTVVEGAADVFGSHRRTKRERRANLAEELMADDRVADYAKRKFVELSTTSTRPTGTFGKRRRGARWKRR